MDIGIDRSIAARTAQQHGLITSQQLTTLGATRGQVRHRVATGRLEPVGRGAYILVGSPPTRRQAILAACLATDGVASHQTSGALHGLRHCSLTGPIEVSVRERSGCKRTAAPVIVHPTTTLTTDDLVTVDGIPTMSVARTILGLAALVPRFRERDLADVIDVAVRDGLATDRWLWWRLEQLRRSGRNGVLALESALADRVQHGAPESWLERETLTLIRAAGLPAPVCQRRIRARGAFIGRVDLVYEDVRTVIEVDGHRTHSSREELAADAERANALQLAGYRVLRFTYDDVVRRPQFVVATIRAALASASISSC